MQRVEKQARLERATGRALRARSAAKRHQRRAMALRSLVLGLAIAFGGYAFRAGLTGNEMVQAAVARAQSLSDLMNERSPGARTIQDLTKTRRADARADARRAPRKEVQPASLEKAAPPKVAELLAGLSIQSPPLVFDQVPGMEEPGVFPPAPGAITLAGEGPGSPSSASPPATFPTTDRKQPVLVPSAVPEPASWASMLLGFGLLGWRLRRRTKTGANSLHAS